MTPFLTALSMNVLPVRASKTNAVNSLKVTQGHVDYCTVKS